MKLFIVLCIVIVPMLGQLIQPTESEFQPSEYTPPKLSPRVVNGKFAASTQFPWQVSIQPVINDTMQLLVRCSGSLISSNRILTAAHCIRNYATFKIGLGNTNINKPQIQQIVSRQNVVIHPRYNYVTLNNDIAIIQLNDDVQFSALVKAIRLPSRAQTTLDYFSNRLALMSGWGRTNDTTSILTDLLQFTNLNVTTNSNCKTVYGDMVVLNSTLCGYGIPVTSGPCGGDSGSPLALIDLDGVATQIGLFSFVADYGCSNGYPAGFIDVATYLDWISRHTGIPIRDF